MIAAVIPAWNEAESLEPLLVELQALTPPVDLVVVVDGGSADRTADVARAAGAMLVIQRRRGYGAACWEGFTVARAAGATAVVFLDGDGSDPPAALPRLLEPLESGAADLVLGVRRAAHGKAGAVPWHARAGNHLVCALIGLRTGRWVSDLPSMKVISVAGLEALGMSEMGYGWTTELIATALIRGYRVLEIPVVSRARTAGVSKVSGNVLASVRAGYALIRTALQATSRVTPLTSPPPGG